ncbi:hypothetical protein IV203_024053 [Nitzschia inconspicua]|uniref:Uncharacterized protein n=1 Tax=Nitzschia inconspicua TaxID=303405 RepID=A0A9K3PB51_9STRA|nr:hypothetical protein IV203_024053 [Nitzschia inconspicua]
MGSCQSTEDTTFVPPSSGNTTVGTTSVVTDAYSGTANLVPERSPKNNHETKNKPPLHPLAASVSTTDQNSHLNEQQYESSTKSTSSKEQQYGCSILLLSKSLFTMRKCKLRPGVGCKATILTKFIHRFFFIRLRTMVSLALAAGLA